MAAWLLVGPAPGFLAAKAAPSAGGHCRMVARSDCSCVSSWRMLRSTHRICFSHAAASVHHAVFAEGESEPYLLGDSDSLGDRGFQRATKKSFTFTSHYLGQLQRVRPAAGEGQRASGRDAAASARVSLFRHLPCMAGRLSQLARHPSLSPLAGACAAGAACQRRQRRRLVPGPGGGVWARRGALVLPLLRMAGQGGIAHWAELG